MTAEKQKRSFAYTCSRLIGERARRALIRRLVRRPPSAGFCLPDDIIGAERFVVILPEDTTEALMSLPHIMSILALAKNPSITIICADGVGGFFETLHGGARVIEYDPVERYLFSPTMKAVADQCAHETFDICLFLESSPDLSLLHLAGRIAASIRIGFKESGDGAFFNIRLPAARLLSPLPGDILLAQAIGVPPAKKALRWSISKDMLEETALAFSEAHIPPQSQPVAIDAGCFFSACGQAWTTRLIEAIVGIAGRPVYLYADSLRDSSFVSWVSSLGIPVFSRTSPVRMAALLQCSGCVVAGRSASFQLATLLSIPAAGIFNRADFSASANEQILTSCILFDKTPDDATIAATAERVTAALAALPAKKVRSTKRVETATDVA